MILRRLELKPFGRFEDCAFDFRRGFNLVVGPSESGKSTLAEAVPRVLFGTPDRERFKPWGGPAGCAAALVFEEAGRLLRIERDFLTDQISLNETDLEGRSLRTFSSKAANREETTEGRAYREELLQLLGLAEEAQFRFGLFFEQGYVNRFAVEGGISEATSLLTMLAGREDSAASGGEDEIVGVRRRLAELEQHWFETRKALAEASELPGKIADLEALIEADRADFIQRESALAQLRRECGGTETAASPVVVDPPGEPASDLEARLQQLERELAKTGLPRQMPADLPAVLVQADEIRQEMIAIQKEAADLRQQLLKRPAPSWRPAALTTLLSVLLVGTVALVNSAWLSAGLAAGALATAAAWAIFLWRLGQERQERNRRQGPLQVLEERRDEAQARLAGLDERFTRLGLSPSAVEIVRMQKNLERHLRLQQELAELECAMAGTGSGGESAAADRVSTQVSVRAEEQSTGSVAEDLATTGGVAVAAAAELSALGEGLQGREAELSELIRQAAAQDSLRESLRRIEEEGESLRRRESELARRPISASPAAVSGIPHQALTQLAANVGQTLAALTADRYTAVRFEEAGDCSLRGADGQWHPLQYFSRGTTESFWLAFRLNLGRQLTGARRPPLILDDALAGFDRDRLGDTVKVLERLAGEQQVILLSRDEALRKRASRERWHAISLATETTQKTSRFQERSDDDGQLHLL